MAIHNRHGVLSVGYRQWADFTEQLGQKTLVRSDVLRHEQRRMNLGRQLT
jgi:hypothetical protein